MKEFIISDDFIMLGVLSVVIFIVFLFGLKGFLRFLKRRRKFYEDYIPCFHSEEYNLGWKIIGFFSYLLFVVMSLTRNIRILLSLEDVSYQELTLCIVSFITLSCYFILYLISYFIKVRTASGISSEYISINSLLIPKEEVVYEEYENEIVIYRKSKKKGKGRKLASQVYHMDRDYKLIDYIHKYYQEYKTSV